MKSNSSQTSALSVPVRIKTIDVFRALTMFLMLFVNDIPGLRDIPHWLGHAEGNEDMMGFADTIFPAFLFVMGVSIPFAIQNRFRKGESLLQAGMHILWRTVSFVFRRGSPGIDKIIALFVGLCLDCGRTGSNRSEVENIKIKSRLF